ncbi:hypothetical protein K438DRAFT_497080 [Mycena galopus ATCC 62051]|nr:hypothetical protein K438DRAFT_497080 [Mycena galopus ATCC 62051]
MRRNTTAGGAGPRLEPLMSCEPLARVLPPNPHLNGQVYGHAPLNAHLLPTGASKRFSLPASLDPSLPSSSSSSGLRMQYYDGGYQSSDPTTVSSSLSSRRGSFDPPFALERPLPHQQHAYQHGHEYHGEYQEDEVGIKLEDAEGDHRAPFPLEAGYALDEQPTFEFPPTRNSSGNIGLGLGLGLGMPYATPVYTSSGRPTISVDTSFTSVSPTTNTSRGLGARRPNAPRSLSSGSASASSGDGDGDGESGPASAVSGSFPLFGGQHSPQPYSPTPNSRSALPHPHSPLAQTHSPRQQQEAYSILPRNASAYPQYLSTPPQSASAFAHCSPHASSLSLSMTHSPSSGLAQSPRSHAASFSHSPRSHASSFSHSPRSHASSFSHSPRSHAGSFAHPPHASASLGHSPHVPALSFAHSHSPLSHAGFASASGSSQSHHLPTLELDLQQALAPMGAYNSQTPELFTPQQTQCENADEGFTLVTPTPQYAFDHHLARVLDASASAGAMQGADGVDELGVEEEQQRQQGDAVARAHEQVQVQAYGEMEMKMEVDALLDSCGFQAASIGVLDEMNGGGSVGGTGTAVHGWVEPPSMPLASSSSATHALASLASASSLHALSPPSYSHSPHAHGSPSNRLLSAWKAPSPSPSGVSASGSIALLSLSIPQSHARTRIRTHSDAVDPALDSAASIASFMSGNSSFALRMGDDESMPPPSPITSDGDGGDGSDDFGAMPEASAPGLLRLGLGRTLSEDGGLKVGETSPNARGAGRPRAATVSVPSAL